jgi:hypothetical protein
MAPVPPAGVLASRFLEPLTRPWALLGGGIAGGGVLWAHSLAHGAELALRLLGVLLSI